MLYQEPNEHTLQYLASLSLLIFIFYIENFVGPGYYFFIEAHFALKPVLPQLLIAGTRGISHHIQGANALLGRLEKRGQKFKVIFYYIENSRGFSVIKKK